MLQINCQIFFIFVHFNSEFQNTVQPRACVMFAIHETLCSICLSKSVCFTNVFWHSCVLYVSWSHPDIYVTCCICHDHTPTHTSHVLYGHICCICHDHILRYTLHVWDTPNKTFKLFSCLTTLEQKNAMTMKIMHLMRSQQTRKEHMKKSSIEHNYLRIATLMLGFHQRSHCFISRAMQLKRHQTYRTGEGEHVMLICLIKHFR